MLELLRTAVRNIRLFLAVVIGVPILIIAGVMAALEWWSGSGTLHVVASPGETVSLSIDGAPPEVLYPNQHFTRELAQGPHLISVVGAMGQSSMPVAVTSGMWQQLVPTSPQQCWVELEVYDFYYAPSRGLPTIAGRYPASAPISIGSGEYFDETALPRSVSEHASVELMQSVPCSVLSLPDDQLITGLGFVL